MARHPRAEAVVAAVMEQMGLTTAGELAAVAGKPAHADLSPVRQWMRGEVAPGFGYILEMLSRAGLLQPEAEAAYKGITLREAERAVERARAAATEARARALGASQELPPHRRRTA